MSNLSCPMYAVQCSRPTDLTTKLSRHDSSSRRFGSLGQLVNCIGHSTWDIRHLTTASLSHEFRVTAAAFCGLLFVRKLVWLSPECYASGQRAANFNQSTTSWEKIPMPKRMNRKIFVMLAF